MPDSLSRVHFRIAEAPDSESQATVLLIAELRSNFFDFFDPFDFFGLFDFFAPLPASTVHTTRPALAHSLNSLLP